MEKCDAESIKNKFKSDFCGCADFNLRTVEPIKDFKLYVANIGNFSDRTFISETLIKPLTFIEHKPESAREILGIAASSEFSEIKDYGEALDKVLSGSAVLFTDIGEKTVFFAAPSKNSNGRSVSEPDSEGGTSEDVSDNPPSLGDSSGEPKAPTAPQTGYNANMAVIVTALAAAVAMAVTAVAAKKEREK